MADEGIRERDMPPDPAPRSKRDPAPDGRVLGQDIAFADRAAPERLGGVATALEQASGASS